MTKTGMMTARELIQSERKTRLDQDMPVPRYAVNPDESSIAAWSESLGRWVCIAGQLIHTDEWCSMRHEILVNGVPLSEQIKWTEVMD